MKIQANTVYLLIAQLIVYLSLSSDSDSSFTKGWKFLCLLMIPLSPFLNPNFYKSIVKFIVFVIYVAFTHMMGGYYFVEKQNFV